MQAKMVVRQIDTILVSVRHEWKSSHTDGIGLLMLPEWVELVKRALGPLVMGNPRPLFVKFKSRKKSRINIAEV